MDYHVVGTQTLDGGTVSHRVILAAAYREPIDHFAAAFDAAEIQLDAIDVEAFALLRAVAPPSVFLGRRPDRSGRPRPRPRSHHARDLGRQGCDFTRVLEWGGGRLDAAIARELGVTTRRQRRSSSACRSCEEDPANARARNAVKHELTTLARELVASLQFYQAQPDSLALSEILVTGGTTRMPGFIEELERLVRARVRPADPLGAVQADANISARNDLASLAIAIGLGVDR